MMWQAKHTDFDTATGFDVEYLLGAGLAATTAHLTEHGHPDIAQKLATYPEAHEDLATWLDFRRDYFYPGP